MDRLKSAPPSVGMSADVARMSACATKIFASCEEFHRV
jgi:hypothetical protein